MSEPEGELWSYVVRFPDSPPGQWIRSPMCWETKAQAAAMARRWATVGKGSPDGLWRLIQLEPSWGDLEEMWTMIEMLTRNVDAFARKPMWMHSN